jgi:hypothetical protein
MIKKVPKLTYAIPRMAYLAIMGASLLGWFDFRIASQMPIYVHSAAESKARLFSKAAFGLAQRY